MYFTWHKCTKWSFFNTIFFPVANKFLMWHTDLQCSMHKDKVSLRWMENFIQMPNFWKKCFQVIWKPSNNLMWASQNVWILTKVEPKTSEYSLPNGSMVLVTGKVELMYDDDLIAFEIIHIKEARENLIKHNIKGQLDIFLPKFGFKKGFLCTSWILQPQKKHSSIATQTQTLGCHKEWWKTTLTNHYLENVLH